jgi:hypothetical protein
MFQFVNRGYKHRLAAVAYIFTLGTVIVRSRVWSLCLLYATVVSLLFADLFNGLLPVS